MLYRKLPAMYHIWVKILHADNINAPKFDTKYNV